MPSDIIQPILVAKSVCKTIARRFNVGPVDLTLHPGDMLLVTGPTGSGKSILLQLFAGMLRPDAGTLQVCGEPLREHAESRRHVGYLSHDAQASSELPVRDYLQFCAMPWNPDPDYLPYLVQKAMNRVRFSDTSQDPVSGLSPQLQRRLALARAIIQDPELVLLDDPIRPTQAGSTLERQAMLEIMQTLRAAGKALVVSSQHADLYRPIATHGLFLAGGQVYACTDLRVSNAIPMRIRRVELFLGTDVAQERALKFIKACNGVLFAECGEDGFQIILEGEADDVKMLINQISQNGYPVITFQERAGAF
ncbi:MAG: ABC transporter ATP-binding protein [Candidatus Xenobia bacterium]